MKQKLILTLINMILFMGCTFAQTEENYYSQTNRMDHYYDSVRSATPAGASL